MSAHTTTWRPTSSGPSAGSLKQLKVKHTVSTAQVCLLILPVCLVVPLQLCVLAKVPFDQYACECVSCGLRHDVDIVTLSVQHQGWTNDSYSCYSCYSATLLLCLIQFLCHVQHDEVRGTIVSWFAGLFSLSALSPHNQAGVTSAAIIFMMRSCA